MFENHRKSLIFNIVSEANYVYILSGQKFLKMPNLASFWKREAYSQTVLPDMSVVIRQKMVEKAKLQKFKWDILGDFQTMCSFEFKKEYLGILTRYSKRAQSETMPCESELTSCNLLVNWM